MFGSVVRKYEVGGPMQSQSQTPDQGLDLEGQLRQGVEAFMQSQDPAIAIEVVNMLAQMMGIAPEMDQYQDDASQNQPTGAYPGNQQPQANSQVPMGRLGMRIYKVGGKIDPPKKKAKTNQTVTVPPQKPVQENLLVDYDTIPPIHVEGVMQGSGAGFERQADKSLKRIQRPDYAGVSQQTMIQDRKTAAGNGNGFFTTGVAPSLGGVSPDDLIGVRGPRTGKRIVYLKKKGT